jgi:hypothetical protein
MSPVGGRSRSGRFTVRLSAGDATAVQRLAALWGVSPSRAASQLVVEALLADVEHQHGSLIEVAVQHAIRVELDRLGDLLVRTVLYSDEGRRMIFAALVSELGSDRARSLRREAHSAAWQRLKEPLEPPAEPQPEQRNGAWPAASGRS